MRPLQVTDCMCYSVGERRRVMGQIMQVVFRELRFELFVSGCGFLPSMIFAWCLSPL